MSRYGYMSLMTHVAQGENEAATALQSALLSAPSPLCAFVGVWIDSSFSDRRAYEIGFYRYIAIQQGDVAWVAYWTARLDRLRSCVERFGDDTNRWDWPADFPPAPNTTRTS